MASKDSSQNFDCIRFVHDVRDVAAELPDFDTGEERGVTNQPEFGANQCNAALQTEANP